MPMHVTIKRSVRVLIGIGGVRQGCVRVPGSFQAGWAVPGMVVGVHFRQGAGLSGSVKQGQKRRCISKNPIGEQF